MVIIDSTNCVCPYLFQNVSVTTDALQGLLEPPHDKMTVRPAKTQVSLDIHPVWSVFAVRSCDS